MSRRVKISAAMSVYNPPNPEILYRAVQSVVRQSFQNWEMILYDDGSGETRARWITQAAAMDGRIRYVRGEENRGLAYGLNQCIRHSSGSFIARMDADDICRPQRFEKQYAFLKNHPEYAWVGSNAELIDAAGVWGLRRMPKEPEKEDFLYNSPYIHPSVMFRREVLTQNGGYDSSAAVLQCEDYELFMRLHAKGFRGYNLQEALLLYREDYASMKKRTYRRRLRETGVRIRGFGELGILRASTLGYVLKPLAVGLVPQAVRHYIQREKKGGTFL